ncbi:hypothetical protein EUGRSUZ_G03180, partial [Eucalyptus grandis]
MCLSMLDDEPSISYDAEDIPKRGCISAVNVDELESHHGDRCSAEELSWFCENQKSEEVEMESMKMSDTNCEWIRERRVLKAVYSMLVNSYIKEDMLKIALEASFKGRLLKIFPSAAVCNSLLQALLRSNQSDLAWDFLEEMQCQGIGMNASIISLFINDYCIKGDIRSAWKLVTEMKNFGIKADMLCRDHDMSDASKLFLEMPEVGLHPDCYNYTTMIRGYCKAGDTKRALHYFGKMLKSGNRPSTTTYAVLVDVNCQIEDMGKAEHVLQIMMKDGLVPDVVVCNTLMHLYGKKGCLHKIFKLLGLMTTVNISPDIITYNTIIHSLMRNGFMTQARDILDELVQRGFSPDVVTFTSVIDGFAKRGNFEEAFLVWSSMKVPVQPDIITCSALLSGYCRANRMEEANILFRKMLDAGLRPDLILYNTLIHGFCKIGCVEDACCLVNMMVQGDIYPNNATYRALVLGFEKKRVRNPAETAHSKLQEILVKNGIYLGVDAYLSM